MYLRSVTKKVKGKTFRYWRLVESVRTERGPRQKIVAHLGDLSKFGPEDWQRLAERMESPEIAAKLERRVKQGGRRGRPAHWTLWDRVDTSSETVQVKLGSIKLKKVTDFGDVYVGLQLWRRLRLGKLMQDLTGSEPADIPIPLICALIAVNRLVHPCSELAMVEWFRRTALGSLLGIGINSVNEDRLYRTLDAVVIHKERIEEHLAGRGEELFGCDYSYLLYDLTSIYFEGQGKENPKAKRGYSRDHRPDCLQVCIGVVIDRYGFPVGYEVLSGNTKDFESVLPMLDKLEARFGKPGNRRLLCMDRGLVTEDNLKLIRSRRYRYVLAERRSESRRWWKEVDDKSWRVMRSSKKGEVLVEVQEVAQEDGDRIILVRSKGCQQKEKGIHNRLLTKLTEALDRLKNRVRKGQLKDPIKIERAIGANLARHPGVSRWVEVRFDKNKSQIFWHVKEDVADMAREVEGIYSLRTNEPDLSAKSIWEYYIHLIKVENVFRSLKHDLSIRPVFHRKEKRVEAHILFSYLAYVLMWTLEQSHRQKGGTLSGRRILEYLHEIKMGTITMLTKDDLRLRLERVCEPSRQQQEILASLDVTLPRIEGKLEKIFLHL